MVSIDAYPPWLEKWFARPGWLEVDLESQRAEYLGVLLGLNVALEDVWRKPLLRFNTQLSKWISLKVSESTKFFICNTFLIPIFSYILNYYLVPPKFAPSVISKLSLHIFGFHLVSFDVFGLLYSFFNIGAIRELDCISQAAVIKNAYINGCLRIGMCDRQSTHPKGHISYAVSFFKNMTGRDVDRVFKELESKFSKDGVIDMDAVFKSAQGSIYRELMAVDSADKDHRLLSAKKTTRWHFGVSENRVVSRFMWLSRTKISKFFKQKIVIRLLRLFFNGFQTKRRMPFAGFENRRCCFCLRNEDNVEHFFGISRQCCTIIRERARLLCVSDNDGAVRLPSCFGMGYPIDIFGPVDGTFKISSQNDEDLIESFFLLVVYSRHNRVLFGNSVVNQAIYIIVWHKHLREFARKTKAVKKKKDSSLILSFVRYGGDFFSCC